MVRPIFWWMESDLCVHFPVTRRMDCRLNRWLRRAHLRLPIVKRRYFPCWIWFMWNVWMDTSIWIPSGGMITIKQHIPLFWKTWKMLDGARFTTTTILHNKMLNIWNQLFRPRKKNTFVLLQHEYVSCWMWGGNKQMLLLWCYWNFTNVPFLEERTKPSQLPFAWNHTFRRMVHSELMRIKWITGSIHHASNLTFSEQSKMTRQRKNTSIA